MVNVPSLIALYVPNKDGHALDGFPVILLKLQLHADICQRGSAEVGKRIVNGG